MSDRASHRPSTEWVVVTGALCLAALFEVRSFGGWVAAYLASWAVMEVLLRTRMAAQVRAAPKAWLALAAVVPLSVLARDAHHLIAAEGLHHASTRLVDRSHLRSPLALDPEHLRADGPQRLMVWARGASEVAIEWGDQRFAGTALGIGVFAVEIDPAQRTPVAGPSEVTLIIDGERSPRTLDVFVPQAHPRGLVLDESGEHACATSEETDELFWLDAAEVRRLPVADAPVACGFVGESIRVVHRSGLTSDLDAHGTVLAELAGGPSWTAMAAQGETAAQVGRIPSIAEGLQSVLVVSPGEHRLELPGIADHVALATDLEGVRYALVALRGPTRLVVVRLDRMEIVAERDLLAPVIALATRGPRVIIAVSDFGDERHLGNHYVDDQLLELTLPDLVVHSVLHTAGRTPHQDHAGDVDVGAGPVGLSIDREGSVWVSFEGTREVVRYRRFDAVPTRTSLRELDREAHAPQSAVVLSNGTVVIASAASGAILRVHGDSVDILRSGTASELLSRDPELLRVRMGELAFGEATRSGVSCASCHLGGGTDLAAHNIGGRLLAPTLDVRGIAGTAPFLRDGSYPRLSDLHEVAIEEYRGYRRSAGDRGATLEGYLSHTARPAIHVTVDDAQVQRGAEVFERAQCLHCHVPPAFTDLGLHAGVALFPEHAFPSNVTTLDTPSLRGLSESPPYLYDGRAATLREVLTTHNRADRHGHTAELSESELDDLIAFLRALP